MSVSTLSHLLLLPLKESDGVVEGVDVSIGLHRPLRLRKDGVCFSGRGGGLIIGPEKRSSGIGRQ